MKSEKLLRSIGEIDDELVENAAQKPVKKVSPWIKWSALAACLCLLLGGFAIYQTTHQPVQPPLDTPAADTPGIAYYCYLNGNEDLPYEAIDLNDRILYGLVPEGSMGTEETLSYEITQKDLGEPMGTVTKSAIESLVGCDVYHFAEFAQSEAICIIDTPNGYAFYVCRQLPLPDGVENTSSALLWAYGLPDSLKHLEIWNRDGEVLLTIEDDATVREIFQILANKPDIGREAHAKRYIQLWQDTYGNDDVYYDEYNQTWRARELTTPATDPYRGEPDYLDYELLETAHDLFYGGSRWVWVETQNGMSRSFEYCPAICAIQWDNGHYVLTKEEAQRLNVLLEIDELLQ